MVERTVYSPSQHHHASRQEMVRNELGYAFIPSIFLSDNHQFYFEKLFTKNGGVLNLDTCMLYRKSSLALSMVQKFTKYIKSIDF